MASFKSYLSNNAPFLTAREKFQTAGGNRVTAQARWESAKKTDANYELLLNAFKTAQQDEAVAKAALTAAEASAKTAYDNINSKKTAAEQKKKNATTQSQIDLAQAAVDKYTDAGLAVPADKQAKLDELKGKLVTGPPKPTGTTGATGATGATGVTGATGATGVPAVKSANISVDQFIRDLESSGPKSINDIKSYLGFTNLDGKIDVKLVNAIITKENDLQTLIQATGKDIDRITYYSTTKGAGGAGAVPTVFVSDPTQAASYVRSAFKTTLQRDPTSSEIAKYSDILNKAERKSPKKTVNGVTTGGLGSPIEFLTQEVQKLPEFSTKKTEKDTLTTQSLQSIARANGVNLSADQLASYTDEVRNGKDINVIKNTIRNSAGLGMPDSIKKLLADGTDLETIYAPYKQTMASLLEIPSTDISLDDSILRSAIGPDKEMPIYEFRKALKKDARWQYTNNARTEVSDKVLRVLQDFGFQA